MFSASVLTSIQAGYCLAPNLIAPVVDFRDMTAQWLTDWLLALASIIILDLESYGFHAYNTGCWLSPYSLGTDFRENILSSNVLDCWVSVSCRRNVFTQPFSLNGPWPCQYFAWLQILTTVTVRNMVFWVLMPYSSENITFQRNILPPSSELKNKPSKESAEIKISLSLTSTSITSLTWYSTLKMEAVSSSETSTNFYRATRHDISEESRLWEIQIQDQGSKNFFLMK
jgi:hypothetical protein